MLKNVLPGLAAALALYHAPAFGANLLLNGGFETPVIAGEGGYRLNRAPWLTQEVKTQLTVR
jgi:hypothetical protein